MNRTINIAFLAHVDAGKTTITEQILYFSGALRTVGNVDKGTAATDFLQVEKDRGISVISSQVSFVYKHIRVNVLDTPGHADFMSEVERSLLAVDAVVLMVSAADGVQAQTRILWNILDRLKIPRIVLINKVDRAGILLDEVLKDIKKELSTSIIPIQNIENEGEENVKITPFRNDRNIFIHKTEDIIEKLADFDDEILEQYLQNEAVKPARLVNVFKDCFLKAQIFPLMYSVAKRGIGIQEILDEIVAEFEDNEVTQTSDFSGLVYKITHHHLHGKLSHIRVLSGTLEKKQLVYNQRLEKDEKVNQIKSVFSDQLQDSNLLGPGDIAAIAGFNDARVGDVLGHLPTLRNWKFNTTPILTVQVKPVHEQDYIKLSEVLLQLDLEDPLLQFQWFKEENEFHIKINGTIQTEILQQIILDRFQLEVEFDSPKVIYKETPKQEAFGYDAYTMPKPCWAVAKFKIEPAPRGSGFHYHSDIGVNNVLLKYQKEIERTIPLALQQGIKGWEVTDIKITLVEGEDHVVHSRSGDFVIVTPMAIMDGLSNAGTDLLEPMMKFIILGPEEILGQVSSDLVQMRGSFNQPEIENGKVRLEGRVPVATCMDYAAKLANRSAGRASIQLQFDGYQLVDEELGVIREYKGISPLDRAKYILKARKAIQ